MAHLVRAILFLVFGFNLRFGSKRSWMGTLTFGAGRPFLLEPCIVGISRK
jgi:hypothetical protein